MGKDIWRYGKMTTSEREEYYEVLEQFGEEAAKQLLEDWYGLEED